MVIRRRRRNFRDWVGVEVIYGGGSLKIEGYVPPHRKTDGGRVFQSLEVIGTNELENSFIQLESNLTHKEC